MAKLTTAAIVKMKEMKENGVSTPEIAEIFGVTKPAVIYHLNKDYQNRLKEQVKKRSKDLYDNDKNFHQFKRAMYENFLNSHNIPRNERYPTIFDVFLDLEDPGISLTVMELWGKYGSSYKSIMSSLSHYTKKGILIKEGRGRYRLNTENFPAIREVLENGKVKTRTKFYHD